VRERPLRRSLAWRVLDAAHTGLSAGVMGLIVSSFVTLPVLAVLIPLVGEHAMWAGLLVPVVTLAFMLLAGYGSWVLTREALRRHAGQCIRCGYDLRASPGRCPECGWR
jgi:hypothetical protein